MKTLGYYNGEIAELESLRVPILDRGCYFGDGIYDATYAVNGVIYELDEHVDRFFNSARLMEIELAKTKDGIKALLRELIQKLDTTDIFVYWQATRGTGFRNHVYPAGPSNLWVMLKHGAMRNNFTPMKVVLLDDIRFFICNVKTLNLIPGVMANERARTAGADEAILHRDGRVTECAHSNVHIIKDGVFRTAPADNLILPGITRAHLLKVCARTGIPAEEAPFRLEDLIAADEVIISSAGTLCAPVSHIDGKAVGGKDPATLNKIRSAMIADFEAATGAVLPKTTE